MLALPSSRGGGEVMRWLGPLGCVWVPAIMPLHCFVLGVVVSLGFCTLLHSHYILRLNCVH